jgi:hypothetical protein
MGILIRRRLDIQEFQCGKFAVHGHDKLLPTRNRHPKINASHAITMLECEHYSLFIFCSEVVIYVIVMDNKW